MKKITLLLAITCTAVGFSQSFPAPYCGITMANVDEVEEITQVSLNNVIINNSDNINVHIDATSNVINVEPGKTYTIEVKGNTYGTEENQLNMYIDWDQSGILNDAGENYVIGTIFESTGYDAVTASYQFTVPATATLGATRARVSKNWTFVPYIIMIDDPCSLDIDVSGDIEPGYGQILDFTINIQVPNSVKPVDLSSLNVYPNPTTGILNIEYKSDIRQVSIFDITGKQISSHSLNAASSNINVSSLSSGAYLLKVETQENEISTVKFVKQ